jgi:hypothetical protein
MVTLALATRGVARRCNNNAKHVFSNRDVNSAPFEACATANESFNIYLNAREVIVTAASHPVKRSVKNKLALPAIVKCRGDRTLHSPPNTSNRAAVDRHTCIECIRSVGCSCASGCTVLSHDTCRSCVCRSWPDFSKFDSEVKFLNWRPTLALLVMFQVHREPLIWSVYQRGQFCTHTHNKSHKWEYKTLSPATINSELVRPNGKRTPLDNTQTYNPEFQVHREPLIWSVYQRGQLCTHTPQVTQMGVQNNHLPLSIQNWSVQTESAHL